MRAYLPAFAVSIAIHVAIAWVFRGQIMSASRPLPRTQREPIPVAILQFPASAPATSGPAMRAQGPVAASAPAPRRPVVNTKPQAVPLNQAKVPEPVSQSTPVLTTSSSTAAPIRLDGVQLNAAPTGTVGPPGSAQADTGFGGGAGTVATDQGSDGWDIAPRMASTMKPEFPAQLRAQGLEGDVVLQITLDAAGRVTQVVVVEASDYPAFNDAAVAAMGKAMFEPAMRKGQPISARIRFTVRFRLQD